MSFTVGGKNHTPDQGALKAWKEYYASAERSAHTSAEAGAGIGCVGDGGKPGRSHDIPQTCTGYLV